MGLTVPGYGSPAPQFRFIAGGIGIRPILPMLGLTQRRGIEWSMVYAGRSRDSLPFVDVVPLTAIGSALVGRDDVELHFERFAAPPVVDGKEFRCRSPRRVRRCGSAPTRRCCRR